MNDKLIEQVILGAPNFVGFVMLAIIQYRIISKLLDNWKDCERDNEMSTQKQRIEDESK